MLPFGVPFAHRNCQRSSVGSQLQRIGHACRFKRVCVPCPILACSCLGGRPFRPSQAVVSDTNRGVSAGLRRRRGRQRQSDGDGVLVVLMLYSSGLT